MAKAVLTYKLPKEQEEFEVARNGWRYKATLQYLDQWLRTQLKHHTDEMHEKEEDATERIREKLNELAMSHSIDLWD